MWSTKRRYIVFIESASHLFGFHQSQYCLIRRLFNDYRLFRNVWFFNIRIPFLFCKDKPSTEVKKPKKPKISLSVEGGYEKGLFELISLTRRIR